MKRFFLLLAFFLCIENSIAQPIIPVEFDFPKVLFTDAQLIRKGKKDLTLLNTIEDFILATPAGEEITIAIFKFDRKNLAECLVTAQNRGVKVRLIMNKGETSKKDNREVKDYLKKELKDFHYIENDISKKAIIHNKFILFSAISTSEGLLTNVVLQTSSNFLKKSSEKLQDMLIIQDPEIYYGYLDFWYEIKVLGNVGKLDSYNFLSIENEEPNLKVYFFPKRRKEEEIGQDNIIKILMKINDPSKAKIRFAHGKWDDDREDVLSVLKNLSKQGANIEIVTNRNVDEELFKAFDPDLVNITYLPDEINMHTKYFLIEADLGEGDMKIVWTGSHNMTERSLHNNFEVLLAIKDPGIYQDYLDYFNQIKVLGK